MPVAPFVPLIASGIGAYMGRPKGPGKAEKGLTQQQTAGAAQQQQQARALTSFGMPLLQRSGNYYDTILKGNRSAIQSAMAPEINALSDTYKGANLSLQRSGLRGPSRDVASAELNRQKAGQIGSIVLNARPQAAAAVGQLGQFGASGGQQGFNLANSAYSDLVGGARTDRQYHDQQMQQYGGAVGGFITDLLRNVPWNKTSQVPKIGSPDFSTF